MEKILSNITEIIVDYENGGGVTVTDLCSMLRKLTANLYHLTGHNIGFHERHNAIQYKHKGSVSGGLILANEQVPELRMTRKIIESADRVKSGIIMEISKLNREN